MNTTSALPASGGNGGNTPKGGDVYETVNCVES